MNDAPTKAQVFATLAAANALPDGFDYVNYGSKDVDQYDRTLDVLAAVGWLPDPTDELAVSDYSNHEIVTVGGVMFASPVGHKPFTDAARAATPIEKLAETVEAPLIFRVGDVEVEIAGEGADVLREVVARAFAGRAGSPLPSRDESSDTNVIPLHPVGRGAQVAPQGEGA